MILVTRRYSFSAAHVLARADWSHERNLEIYGKCANPAGHGHNYSVEITLRGEPDPQTGRLVPLEHMDAVVGREILAPMDHRFLNHEVPAFQTVVPTAENIARHVWDTLKGEFAPAVLASVRLVETRNNSVEYRGEPEDA